MTRLRTTLTALTTIVLTATLCAQQGVGPAVTFEQLTISTTAVGLAAATVTSDSKPVLSCKGRLEGGPVRVRLDGTSPTSTVGVLVRSGDEIQLLAPDNVSRFKAIRDSTSGSSATLAVTCYAGTVPGGLAILASPTGGSGDLVGPSSATDNAIARFDGTTGKLTQNSGITIADGASGTLSGTNTGDQDLSTLVVGPASVTASKVVLFDGTTGKLVKADAAGISQVCAAAVATITIVNGLVTAITCP